MSLNFLRPFEHIADGAEVVSTQPQSLPNDHPDDHDLSKFQGAAQKLSRTSLEALEKISPAASMHSLQRYLSMPAIEEAVPIETIDAVKRVDDVTSMPVRAIQDYRTWMICTPPQAKSSAGTETSCGSRQSYGSRAHIPRYSSRAKSSAGTETSRCSWLSYGSRGSFKSADSRGSRRGRKRWMRSQQSLASTSQQGTGSRAASPTENICNVTSSSKKQISHSIFCTWPSCNATFKHAFAWRRHEEAVHYQPYQYICCLESTYDSPIDRCFSCNETSVTVEHVVSEHLGLCIYADQSNRTFLRRDQLVQHIKGVHRVLEASVRNCEELLALWKISTTQGAVFALKCGFCALSFSNWKARQDHVLKHLQSGICKHSWWPERMVTPRVEKIRTDDAGYMCKNCGKQCDNVFFALEDHAECVAWSCRYLHDFHAIFASSPAEKLDAAEFACLLCGFKCESTNEHLDTVLEEHAQVHQLRSCSQDRFTDLNSFAKHLAAEHNADWKTKSRFTLHPWACRQWLRLKTVGPIAITAQVFQKSAWCASEDSPFNYDEHELLKL